MDTWKNASVSLRWQPAATGFTGWKGSYFDGETPNTTPVIVRETQRLTLIGGLQRQHRNAQRTLVGAVDAVAFRRPGYYRFTTSPTTASLVDDGNLIIDQWILNDSKSFFADVYLAPGRNDVKVEYFNAAAARGRT